MGKKESGARIIGGKEKIQRLRNSAQPNTFLNHLGNAEYKVAEADGMREIQELKAMLFDDDQLTKY